MSRRCRLQCADCRTSQLHIDSNLPAPCGRHSMRRRFFVKESNMEVQNLLTHEIFPVTRSYSDFYIFSDRKYGQLKKERFEPENGHQYRFYRDCETGDLYSVVWGNEIPENVADDRQMNIFDFI